MELRDIEIFLTLAEELHFGRTAARLHVSQARISQSVKQQERLIGAALFSRTSRMVKLTPVGEQLRSDLLPLYHGISTSLQRARLAAKGVADTVRVGMIPSFANDLRPVWDTFRTRHPQWSIRIVPNSFLDPFSPLRRREVDALIAWLPVEEPDLVAGPVVYTEPRVLATAPDHPLTQHERVSVEVLGNDHGVATARPHLPEYWEDAYIPFQTASGRPIANRLHVNNFEEILMLISTRQMVHPIGAHAIRYFARPDITYLPLADAPDIRWGLIWRSDNESPLVEALAQVVRHAGTLTPR